MDRLVKGKDAPARAKHMARYSHKEWIWWKDKSGELYAAPWTPESVKAALLAIGTQGKFFLYDGSQFGTVYNWPIGLIMLRNFRAMSR